MKRTPLPFKRTRLLRAVAVGLLWSIISGGARLSALETDDEHRLDRSFFVRFGRDLRDVFGAPARWGREDLFTLAAVSGAGFLLFAVDRDIQGWTQERRTASSDNTASFFSRLGDGGILLGLSAGLYAAGEIIPNEGLRQTALLSVESLAAASLFVWTFKVIIGRARPSSGESSGSFHPLAFKNSYWSLPSGHAAASFSVATVIAEQTRGPWVDILAYGLATLTGISRIHQNKHWASDVLLGSALGYFVAKKVCDLNRRRDGSNVTVGLDWARGRRALTLGIAF